MQPPLQCFRDIPAASRLTLAFGVFGMTSTGSTSTDFTSRAQHVRKSASIVISWRMTDLDKARKIVTQRWMSQPEALKESITKAVAEGIALGRKEGLEMATNERWTNEHEALKENVAKAVAEGIALGRKEGLEIALKSIGEGINRLAKTTV